MRASGGHRIGWDEVAAPVRAAVEVFLGSPVVEARNQQGGFSPGLAARCRLADDRRVFVKAVSPDQNRQACRVHRREAEVAAQLPPEVPAPRLRHVHDDGNWVALVFDDVEGRTPTEPWSMDELDLVLPQLERFGRALDPDPTEGLQDVVERHEAAFRGWRRLAGGDGDPDLLPEPARRLVGSLAELEAGWPDAARGSALLHADLRADNLLLDAAGRLHVVDWPWACTGARFVDLVLLLPSIGLGGGPDPATVLGRHALFADIDPDRVRAVMAAVTGFFLRSCLDPPPPGLPRLRAFQHAQAEVALRWIDAGWPGL